MRTSILSIVTAGLAVWAIAESTTQGREWTDATGKHSLEAEFVELDDYGNVVLRDASERQVTIPLDKLSANDRDFVRTLVQSEVFPSLEPVAGLDIATNAEIQDVFGKILRPANGKGNIELKLAAPLSRKNLEQLLEMDRVLRRVPQLSIGSVYSFDENLARLVEPIAWSKGVPFDGGLNKRDDVPAERVQFKSKCLVLVGFMNSDAKSIRADRHYPLESYLYFRKKNAYVFEGAREMHESDREKLAKFSKSAKTLIWAPGAPAQQSFADFVSMLFVDRNHPQRKLGLGDTVSPFESR